MALGPRLDLRQTQSLVMTPQLQQAIKLLALSNLEIEAFIAESLDANPLLELDRGEASDNDTGNIALAAEPRGPDDRPDQRPDEREADALMDGDAASADSPLDVEPGALDPDRAPGDGDWGIAAGGPLEDLSGLENRASEAPNLAQYLTAQLGLAARSGVDLAIAARLIGELDEAGYLTGDLREIAAELDVTLTQAERALKLVQSLEPTGVGARSLGECLALQAREADRYDPAMAQLIDNLELLAAGEIARLRRICAVDDEDFADMLAELRGYDPKPGLRYGAVDQTPVIPDVLIIPKGDGNWDIRINQDSLPRLVVNRAYYLELRQGCVAKRARAWLGEKLADAKWLIRALDQRQKTILKVVSEIVKRQQGFFHHGVTAMKPMVLREVAEAIAMHESTVSRVTSNKYLHCPRGTFELKFFFSSGVTAADGEGASSEAIKARIRALIDAEGARNILSDAKLAELLGREGFDLARRTVAKYREAIGIGSSAERRRANKLKAL